MAREQIHFHTSQRISIWFACPASSPSPTHGHARHSSGLSVHMHVRRTYGLTRALPYSYFTLESGAVAPLQSTQYTPARAGRRAQRHCASGETDSTLARPTSLLPHITHRSEFVPRAVQYRVHATHTHTHTQTLAPFVILNIAPPRTAHTMVTTSPAHPSALSLTDTTFGPRCPLRS